MSEEPVLINGQWHQSILPDGFFQSLNPSTKIPSELKFPVSGWGDLEATLEASRPAAQRLRETDPDRISFFFDDFAASIENSADILVSTAARETGLPKTPRLRDNELPRMSGQLRLIANAVRERTWCRAVIDTSNQIRSKYGPLGGAVAVFGPNNFPFAFNSVGGGDFAAALAAGNPVIAKANPGHPETTRILAAIAFESLEKAGLHPSSIQMIYHMRPETGMKLVSHPLLAASAFTGSRGAGTALKSAADRAGKLFYAEMSGVNPVFILPGALMERSRQIAEEMSSSCTLGVGQFCTKPGLVVLIENEKSQEFLDILASFLREIPKGILLGKEVKTALGKSVKALVFHGAELVTGGGKSPGPGFQFPNTLLKIKGQDFLEKSKEFQMEAFGPAALAVLAGSDREMLEIGSRLEGNLTGSIYSHSQEEDEGLYRELESILRCKVGRLLNDCMPTGVAVSPAMVHGGPYPATSHPGFTSVGIPASLLRFAALHCYDRVRHDRLPLELQNPNPNGRMWRNIDGCFTQADIP